MRCAFAAVAAAAALGALVVVGLDNAPETSCATADWRAAPFPAYAHTASDDPAAAARALARDPAAELLVAVPTCKQQASRTLYALREWASRPATRNASRIELAVAVGARADAPPTPHRRECVRAAGDAFGRVHWLHYRLTRLQDTYPRATFVIFLNLAHDAHAAGYRLLLVAEPDLVVLRAHWGDALRALARGPDRWWVRGSPWLGRAGAWRDRRRINGNALYRVEDAEALAFFRWALRSEWIRGYDDQLWLAWERRLESCVDERWLAPRFGYTSAIVNLGYGCADFAANATRATYPDAFLAHVSGGCDGAA